MISKVQWTGKGYSFIAENDRKQAVVMDTKNGVAPTPMELLLFAVMGCSGIDIISIIEKKREKLEHFEAEVLETERAEEHPRVYTRIKIVFRISGEIKPQSARRAVELSMDKYCSVNAVLSKTAKVEYEIHLNGEPV